MERSPGEPIDKIPILAADGTIISSTNPTHSIKVEPGSNFNTSPNNNEKKQFDIEIISVIYDIIRCVEKDPLDNTAKQRESAECSQKILELQKRFEIAREQIKQLPGIDFNKDEQLQQLEQLRSQLKSKQRLLLKYKDTQF